ncbi:hypothetical protein BS47DRAFT_578883 [Hydnum rufescens UP504]|uniref:Uncharacterized protein n=1 Tax=Hydnum rufescens UP504 TaxID=1448309 RepID=A0A9P6AFZ0_9AGAM|nr:hypothetical protein BS47DRAFT_578883 [Hydnum rufescens UP504]
MWGGISKRPWMTLRIRRLFPGSRSLTLLICVSFGTCEFSWAYIDDLELNGFEYLLNGHTTSMPSRRLLSFGRPRSNRHHPHPIIPLRREHPPPAFDTLFLMLQPCLSQYIRITSMRLPVQDGMLLSQWPPSARLFLLSPSRL